MAFGFGPLTLGFWRWGFDIGLFTAPLLVCVFHVGVLQFVFSRVGFCLVCLCVGFLSLVLGLVLRTAAGAFVVRILAGVGLLAFGFGFFAQKGLLTRLADGQKGVWLLDLGLWRWAFGVGPLALGFWRWGFGIGFFTSRLLVCVFCVCLFCSLCLVAFGLCLLCLCVGFLSLVLGLVLWIATGSFSI